MAKVSQELQQKIDEIGEALKRRLDKHYEQYEIGLEFSKTLSPYGTTAKNYGITHDKFIELLESNKYIKIISNIKGKRYILAGDCKMTSDEIQDWFSSEEVAKEAEKEFKKANNYIR